MRQVLSQTAYILYNKDSKLLKQQSSTRPALDITNTTLCPQVLSLKAQHQGYMLCMYAFQQRWMAVHPVMTDLNSFCSMNIKISCLQLLPNYPVIF